MRIVATVRGHDIRSNLRIVSRSPSRITFADGSFIFLDSLSIVNNGDGLIIVDDPDHLHDETHTGLDPSQEDVRWEPEDELDEEWEDDEDYGY